MTKWALFQIAGKLRCIGTQNSFKQVAYVAESRKTGLTHYLQNIRPLASLWPCLAILVTLTVKLIVLIMNSFTLITGDIDITSTFKELNFWQCACHTH